MRCVSALFFLGLLAVLGGCEHAFSSAPRQDSVIGRWRVMTSGAGKQDMLCYAGAAPIRSVGAVTGRKAPYLMITRRVSGKIEISASAGYAYKKGKKVTLAVDKNTYRLFFRDAVAWARNDDDDRDILFALQNARNIEVRATAEAGGASVDTYSPEGFAQALARVRHLCP